MPEKKEGDEVMLRRRSYLVEATYTRDARVRKTAGLFFNQLVKYLKQNADELVPRSDGGFSVHAREFWNHPRGRNFGVVFFPSAGSQSGGVGKAGAVDVLVLNILKAPGNKEHIFTRVTSARNVVIHEMAHFLDYGRTRAGGVAGRLKAMGKDIHSATAAEYFNDPGEWNAWWQEGAAALERALQWPNAQNPVVRKHFFGDGSLAALLDRVHRFWDATYLHSLTPKVRRKFDKRLAQLWTAMKRKKLL